MPAGPMRFRSSVTQGWHWQRPAARDGKLGDSPASAGPGLEYSH